MISSPTARGELPRLADLYRSKVQKLAEALQRQDTRLEASETLRGLIDSIVLTPEKGQLRIELRGNLAAMLTVAQQTKRSPESGDLVVPVQMVAGARNQRYLQLWSGRREIASLSCSCPPNGAPPALRQQIGHVR